MVLFRQMNTAGIANQVREGDLTRRVQLGPVSRGGSGKKLASPSRLGRLWVTKYVSISTDVTSAESTEGILRYDERAQWRQDLQKLVNDLIAN
jgi:hypothetical protein